VALRSEPEGAQPILAAGDSGRNASPAPERHGLASLQEPTEPAPLPQTRVAAMQMDPAADKLAIMFGQGFDLRIADLALLAGGVSVQQRLRKTAGRSEEWMSPFWTVEDHEDESGEDWLDCWPGNGAGVNDPFQIDDESCIRLSSNPGNNP
jgi:hypothetical protein